MFFSIVFLYCVFFSIGHNFLNFSINIEEGRLLHNSWEHISAQEPSLDAQLLLSPLPNSGRKNLISASHIRNLRVLSTNMVAKNNLRKVKKFSNKVDHYEFRGSDKNIYIWANYFLK